MDLSGIEERTDGKNSSSTGSFTVFISFPRYCGCSSGVTEKLSLCFSHTNWTCHIKVSHRRIAVTRPEHEDISRTALDCGRLHESCWPPTTGSNNNFVSELLLSATLHPRVLRNVINLALTCRSCSRGRLSCYWTPLNSISTSHEFLYGASWSKTSSTVVRPTEGAGSGSNSWVWRVEMTQPSWKQQVKQTEHFKHVKRKYCHIWMRISSCEIYVFTPELHTFMFITRRFKFLHVKSTFSLVKHSRNTFAFDCFTCEVCFFTCKGDT